MNNNQSIYLSDILDHAKKPKNYGALIDATFCVQQENISCGDKIIMYAIMTDDKITKVSFEGSGCAICLATASKLSVFCINKTIGDILLLSEETVNALLGIELGINRLKCGLLSVWALQQGVRQYKESLCKL